MKKLLITVIAAFSFAAGPTNYGRYWRGTYVVCQDGAPNAALVHHEPLNVGYCTQSGETVVGSKVRISYDIEGLSFTNNPLILDAAMNQNQFEQALRNANLTVLDKEVNGQ